MERKQPAGKAWDEFVAKWYCKDHEGKVALAKEYGVTFGTAKHWVSDSGATQIPDRRATYEKPITVEDIMSKENAVNMDFVFFDLETSGFDADWDILLTAAIKPFGHAPVTFRADDYPTWLTERANDKQMTIDIANELRKHAIVVAHYGSKFDVPFLRAKMYKHDLPILPPMFGIDTWRVAWNNFKMSNRRLGTLAMFANVDEKENVDGTRWMRAAFNGEKEAMDKIMEHNILDVEILEKVSCMVFPFLKSIPRL